MPSLTIQHFDQYLEQYLQERHAVFNHQLSGVQANRRDLDLFSRFLHEKGYGTITGDVLLAFIASVRKERHNSAGAINRKMSCVTLVETVTPYSMRHFEYQ